LLIVSKTKSIAPPLLIFYRMVADWVNQRIFFSGCLHFIKASPSNRYVSAVEVFCWCVEILEVNFIHWRI
jgi:hypothetical protein